MNLFPRLRKLEIHWRSSPTACPQCCPDGRMADSIVIYRSRTAVTCKTCGALLNRDGLPLSSNGKILILESEEDDA